MSSIGTRAATGRPSRVSTTRALSCSARATASASSPWAASAGTGRSTVSDMSRDSGAAAGIRAGSSAAQADCVAARSERNRPAGAHFRRRPTARRCAGRGCRAGSRSRRAAPAAVPRSRRRGAMRKAGRCRPLGRRVFQIARPRPGIRRRADALLAIRGPRRPRRCKLDGQRGELDRVEVAGDAARAEAVLGQCQGGQPAAIDELPNRTASAAGAAAQSGVLVAESSEAV